MEREFRLDGGPVWELTHVWTGQRCVEHSPGFWGLYSMSYVYTLRYPLLRPQKLLRHTTERTGW